MTDQNQTERFKKQILNMKTKLERELPSEEFKKLQANIEGQEAVDVCDVDADDIDVLDEDDLKKLRLAFQDLIDEHCPDPKRAIIQKLFNLKRRHVNHPDMPEFLAQASGYKDLRSKSKEELERSLNEFEQALSQNRNQPPTGAPEPPNDAVTRLNAGLNRPVPNDERQELAAQIAELNSQLDELNKKLDKRTKKLKKLQQAVKQQLKDAFDQGVDSRNQEVSDLKAEIDQLTKKLSQAEKSQGVSLAPAVFAGFVIGVLGLVIGVFGADYFQSRTNQPSTAVEDSSVIESDATDWRKALAD